MKMIKFRLRNRLGETNLSHLMTIALESTKVLSDEDLEHYSGRLDEKTKKNCHLTIILYLALIFLLYIFF